jgi:hypothetical protein
MNLIPENLSYEEAEEYVKTLNVKDLTGEQRLIISCQLSDMKRQKIIDEIKKEHPDFTKKQVILEVIRRCYGEKLAEEVAASESWKNRSQD